MRMWMVNPKLLCQRHLLSEHCDIHRFISSVRVGHDVRRCLIRAMIDPSKVYQRHAELEEEIAERGGRLNSPLLASECNAYAKWYGSTTINISRSLSDLSNCCIDCQSRIGKFIYIAFNTDYGV